MTGALEGFPPEWAALAPLALALGFVLYLTLVGIAILPLVPVAPRLPGELDLLATPFVIVPAVLLYLLGWYLGRRRIPELFWEVGNIGVRGLAAGLLALLVLPGESTVVRVLGVLATGTVAAWLQYLRVGWITLDHHVGRLPARRWIQKVGLDTLALGVVWLTANSPGISVILAAIVLLLLAARSGPAYRAGRLSVIALAGLFRVLAGSTGWRVRSSLPRRVVRRSGEPPGEPGRTIRITPAAVLGPKGRGPFQDGWLVAGGGAARFISNRRGTRSRPLLRAAGAPSPGLAQVLTEIEVSDAEGELLLMVPAGGPSPSELETLLGRRENL